MNNDLVLKLLHFRKRVFPPSLASTKVVTESIDVSTIVQCGGQRRETDAP